MNLETIVQEKRFRDKYSNFAPTKFSIEFFNVENKTKIELLWLQYPKTTFYLLIGFRKNGEKWSTGSPLYKNTTLDMPVSKSRTWRPLSKKEVFTIFLQNNEIRKETEKVESGENIPWYAPAGKNSKNTYYPNSHIQMGKNILCDH